MIRVRSMAGNALVAVAHVDTEWDALKWGRSHVDAGRTVLIRWGEEEYTFQQLNQSRSSAGLPCA